MDPGFFDDQAREILDAIRQRGDAGYRLGITIGPLAPDYTELVVAHAHSANVRGRIEVSHRRRLHIDDSEFRMNRSDLWGNQANIEWLEWSGTPNTGQYVN
jgi:hypothetical protein